MFAANSTTEYKVCYFNILSFIVLKLSLLLLLFFIILTVTLESSLYQVVLFLFMIFIVCNNFYKTFSHTEENKPTSEGPQVALQDVSFKFTGML